jgi:hypothetical protein
MKKTILFSVLLFTLLVNTNAQSITSHAMVYSKKISNAITPLFVGQLKTPQVAFTEDSTKPKKDADYYIAKSNDQRTTAWVLLGGGALCTGIGVLIFPKDYGIFGNSSETESKATLSVVLSIVGFAAMISSIPVFVTAAKNKRKAMLLINNQKTGLGIPLNVGKDITGVTITIPIGK